SQNQAKITQNHSEIIMCPEKVKTYKDQNNKPPRTMAIYDYDEVSDSLLISSKKKGDKTKGSIVISNIVLDFNTDKKIVGLEIRKVTSFFKKLGIKIIPADITDANITPQYSPGGFTIYFRIRSDGREQRIPLFIATEAQQLAIT
ncbi:MAG: DUF2283 domain-containing protein, partial [Candidatus Nanoarchaeia archaeon]